MKVRILLISILAMSFFAVMVFADNSAIKSGDGTNPGDNPGQTIDNPWAHLFTTAPETTTEEPTTEAPTETSTEETTTESSNLEWTELFDGLGQATITNTSTETEYGATFEGFVTDNSWGGDSKWQGQARVSNIPTVEGTDYVVSVDLSATPAKKMLIQALSGGVYTEKEYTIDGEEHVDFIFTASGSDTQIVIAFGSFDDEGTYDIGISNMTVSEYVEPTTETPTETTTEAPTTEAPTTQAPTKEPTTAVTTTTLPDPIPIIKVPNQVQIKKIAKKKKSAKKIKVTIKKVKGANGYQVAVYKSKKTAKKNKKALVKKTTTKAKVTIKSKKLKKKKKLFVRARAYVLDGTTKEFGGWSKIKKVKIKK